MLLSICPGKICFLDPLCLRVICPHGHTSTWTEKIKKGPVNKHPDQQGRLSTTESPLIHQAINTNSFKTSLYLHEKNVKKKPTMTTTKLPLETFFNWDTKFIIPPLSVFMQSQKKYCHQFKRITAFVYFRMSLCQKSKYTIVFVFCLCTVKMGYKV